MAASLAGNFCPPPSFGVVGVVVVVVVVVIIVVIAALGHPTTSSRSSGIHLCNNNNNYKDVDVKVDSKSNVAITALIYPLASLVALHLSPESGALYLA